MYKRLSNRRKATQARRLDALRRGRDRANAAKAPREYPLDLPDLRRELIVIDYDTGQPVTHTLHFYKSRRVDVYRLEADGKPRKCCGWSAALEGLRKAYPRVPSPRSDFWR
jgi:hypothetical protein